MRATVAYVRSALRSLDLAYVVLAAGVVVLAWSNFQLRTDRAVMTRQLREFAPGLTGERGSQAGDIVPALTGFTLDGVSQTVQYEGAQRNLLLVYDPRCGVCMSEVPLWKDVAEQAQGAGVSVHWVSLADADLTRKGLERDNLLVDPLLMTDVALQRAYRVVSIPQVLLVDAPGRVAWAHHGAMPEEQQNALLAALRGAPGP